MPLKCLGFFVFFSKGKEVFLLGGMHVLISSCRLVYYSVSWLVLSIGNRNLICCVLGKASLEGTWRMSLTVHYSYS